MIELAQHIEHLLLENDCVIVPGFGGFVAHYAPATYIKEEQLFLPPIRTIGFNPLLTLNDGVLVQSYMAAHDTNFSDATRMVEKEVSELVSQLQEESKMTIDNIGELHYNIYGNYEFVPFDHKIITSSLYGLDSFEMQELSALKRREERVSVPSASASEKKRATYQINVDLSYFRHAAAIVAAVTLFFAFSTRIENTDIPANNYAKLLPDALFEQIERQSIAVTPVTVNQHLVQQGKKKVTSSQKNFQAAVKSSSTSYKPKAEQTSASAPVAVREVKVPKQRANTATTTVAPAKQQLQQSQQAQKAQPQAQQQAKRPYHIIVAGGIGMKDAEIMANQLKAKGFPEAKALNTDGKVRVSIRSFSNREEATGQMLELRKNEQYKNAWLLAQ